MWAVFYTSERQVIDVYSCRTRDNGKTSASYFTAENVSTQYQEYEYVFLTYNMH